MSDDRTDAGRPIPGSISAPLILGALLLNVGAYCGAVGWTAVTAVLLIVGALLVGFAAGGLVWHPHA